MTMSTEGMILTTAGRNMLALALTGKTLTFTRAYCGDGVLGTKSPASLTELISPKRELPIQSMRTTENIGTAEVVVEMNNKNLIQGFHVREYGLFALHPETGKETLYAYCNKGDECGYLEGDNGVDIVNYTLSLVTVIDQAPNVTAYITSTNQYVTVQRLESRIADIFGKFKAIKGFWTYAQGDDQKLRPATIAQAREVLVGSSDLDNLNSRLERLEDNMSQILLELELQSVFPGYTHFILEDFKVVNQIDTYQCKVTSVVAGDDSIDCEPLDGMLPGSVYTLTDGVNSELVEVSSISLENGIQRVILKDTVKNTYSLSSCVMTRTSAGISQGSASGSGHSHSVTWSPSLIWFGQSDNSNFNIPLDTSTGNSKAFTLSGDIVLTTDGFVSLGA